MGWFHINFLSLSALFSYVENKQYRLILYYFPSLSVLFSYVENKRYGLISYYFSSLSALSYPVKITWYILLSNCNHILIFPPQFSDIPRKMSAYLRSDSSSAANTRNISGLCKLLNVNNLYLRVFYYFAKSTISHCKMAHIGGWKAPFRTLK